MIMHLSNEQWVRIWQNTDSDILRRKSLERIIKDNWGMLHAQAIKVIDSRMNYHDFINYAVCKLPKVMDGFDESRGYKFISYWVWWLMATKNEFNAKYGSLLKPRYKNIRDDKGKKIGTKPIYQYADSLNTPDYDDIEKIEKLADDEAEESDESPKYVHEILRHLTEDERFVIKAYYGIGRAQVPKCYKEIGESLGLSGERARQLIDLSRRKLKSIISRKALNNEAIYQEIKQLYNINHV